jgi:hypothetical protein
MSAQEDVMRKRRKGEAVLLQVVEEGTQGGPGAREIKREENS